MSTTLRDLFWPQERSRLSERQGDAFTRDILLANLKKIFIFARILLIMDLLFLTFDWLTHRNDLWEATPGYAYLYYAHCVLALALIAFLTLAWRIKPATPDHCLPIHHALFYGFTFFIFYWATAVSCIDQVIHDQITSYVMGTLGAAVVICIGNGPGGVLFLSAFAFFFAGITVFQADSKILLGHYVNGTTITALAWVLSRTLFADRVRDFLNNDTIQHQQEELQRMAGEDYLTSLHNRRYLESYLSHEFSRCRRYGHSLTLAVVDLDGFKRINDNLSHAAGDKVLSEVAGILRDSVRASDVVARYGGDEFVIVFPETSLENARLICERTREALRGHAWNGLDPDVQMTVSVGLCNDLSLDNYEKMLDAADAKLHQAKSAGRDQMKY